MQITIQSTPIEITAGESLLSIVRRCGMDTGSLATRPLAAELSGSVFSLNYVPLRKGEDTLRHAVRLAHGKVNLITLASAEGRRIYERSLLFIFMAAVRRCLPGASVHVDYALGDGIHCTLKGVSLCEEDISRLEEACRKIVSEDHPFLRERLDIYDAIGFFEAEGQADKVDLLSWRNVTYFDAYRLDGMLDYFYGEMVPGTGYVSTFSILPQEENCVLLQLPSHDDPMTVASPQKMDHFSAVFRESSDWGELMECGNVAQLNNLVRSGGIRQLVRINEALHEKRYAGIADEIISRGAKAVLLAGPSSSGKTTSANRLCIQLRVHGKKPVLMSLDDYYFDRDKILPDENGQIDLEHINTIDTELFRSDLSRLLSGESVITPRFDFPTGKRVMDHKPLQADENTIFVIEGLHGLNPTLLPDSVDPKLIYRMYVSALTTLNLDDHNRISTSDIRLLRRMVRDYETRGTSVLDTIAMWPSVRKGEERWIFPFQENADAIFNSSLVYEPVVLKRHIFPLLQSIRPGTKEYAAVRGIVKFLNYFLEADLEDEIPPTSVLREFIGGNAFYRK